MNGRLRCLAVAAIALCVPGPLHADTTGDAVRAAVRDGSDAYDHGQYDRAMQLLAEPVEKGNAEAETIVGLMYWYGEGRAKNQPEAVRLFRLAADQGDARAENVLAFSYQFGFGVAADPAQAVSLYRRAVKGGERRAYYNLGLLTY